ncbi:hypothetical protein VT50_0221395 [Streptomyces antioxidans]|uniref:Putative metallopeptidase domain-containing protein n=1 Tax=Streptomyces antioxidans TaxID=1507734 RepID=A0A1V4D2F4_9ACTN|nr:hypothetical protein [Streptomyces antioxidans]OPF77343.1 hypothetical protein VT50_0221395 [Streptomyces antioxidans]
MDLHDLRRLLAERPGDPALVAEATRLKEAALLDFGVRDSAVCSWLYAKCHHQIPTAAVPTAAVVASGDGSCLLLFNPEFFTEIGADGVAFVLFHEARHLIHRHLYVDEGLRSDPLFTLAAEVSINHVVMTRLRRFGLPVRAVTAPDGTVVREPAGVDPRQVHAEYVRDLEAQGLGPLAYEEFVETDLGVYRELRRMRTRFAPDPLVCVHLGTGADGGGDGRDSDLLLDGETAARVAQEVLEEVARAALRGEGVARDEILGMADRSEGGGEHAARVWGGLGLGALRGRTERTRRVDWWQRWLADTLASKLREGERLVYPKKHGAVLLALGHEPMLVHRGAERTKVVVIALDTSASMSDRVITWITELVGHTDGVESHWLSFDADVMPFVPGERVRGGGGTSFQHVVDYVEGRRAAGGKRCEVEPDAVIVVTDGEAPRVTPARPDRWIWLITDNGDDWPDRHLPPMACHRVRSRDG